MHTVPRKESANVGCGMPAKRAGHAASRVVKPVKTKANRDFIITSAAPLGEWPAKFAEGIRPCPSSCCGGASADHRRSGGGLFIFIC
jgi:hypothetical protein